MTGIGGLNTSATSLTYTGDQVAAGTYNVTAHYAGDANHDPSDGAAVGIDIKKASSTTTTVGAGPFIYTGSTQTGGSGTVTGAGVITGNATVTYSGDQINVGTYSVTAHYAGDTNHDPSNGAAVGIEIKKANATITVTPYNVTYDGAAHTATGTAKGVLLENLSGLVLSGTTHTAAGTFASDAWTFIDVTGNYNNASGTVSDAIGKSHLSVTADDKSRSYGGANPIFTATLAGFKSGQTLATSGVTGSASCSSTATPTTAPGAYAPPAAAAITCEAGTLAATNYDFTPFLRGTLTITFGTCSASVGDGGVILAPINSDGTSVYSRKGGSTIPVKFRVCDASGNPITIPGAVFGASGGSITMLNAVRGTVTVINEATIAEIPDVAFRVSGNQWIFNMATSNLEAGATYTFRINLALGSIQFKVGVK